MPTQTNEKPSSRAARAASSSGAKMPAGMPRAAHAFLTSADGLPDVRVAGPSGLAHAGGQVERAYEDGVHSRRPQDGFSMSRTPSICSTWATRVVSRFAFSKYSANVAP